MSANMIFVELRKNCFESTDLKEVLTFCLFCFPGTRMHTVTLFTDEV